MKKIGVFYGTDGGNTRDIIEQIADQIGKENVEIKDISKASKDEVLGFDNLILATPTYGAGDLQSDWDDIIGDFSESDFAGKTIALVGIGDQDSYSDTFADGISAIYAVAKGGNVIGQTSTDGYEFDDSQSVVDGKFVGLILDQDNQDDLTDERIKNWVSDIKSKFQ
ncbi:MAG: flavodoxin [Helicobacter sp.]|nr:flavodoxin [Helicobacter sp.]